MPPVLRYSRRISAIIQPMNILAIESSCDETAAAVIRDGTTILSSVIATSHDMHEKYGGIVPEVAARKQLESILPVITEALSPIRTSAQSVYQCIERDIDAIAVTHGPGLIGSLLVGVETAKTMAYVTGKPIIPVNHVLAHMYANFLAPQDSDTPALPPEFPAVSLVVSGGHTELYLMRNETDLTWLGGTIDDAAGECFDKTARLLGFGHGGGLAIQEAAKHYRAPEPYRALLPRPMLDAKNLLNFSFSGLKTAILREVAKLKETDTLTDTSIARLSYEVQEAITDVLVKKTLRAADQYTASSILLSGGVASNLRLREKCSILGARYAIRVPPVALCTDNAAYIGSYAFFRGKPEHWKDINAFPDLSVEVSGQ